MGAAQRQANGGPAASHVPGKRLAIVQSSYIPWKGYFDLINSVDEFVLFDDVQYHATGLAKQESNQNLNRARLAFHPGQQQGSVRVSDQRDFGRRSDLGGAALAYDQIELRAGGALPLVYAAILEPLYLECDESLLSAINRRFLSAICEVLGIRTKITWSWDYEILPGKTERLVSICRQAQADTYISGPSAAAYIDAQQFENAGIEAVVLRLRRISAISAAVPAIRAFRQRAGPDSQPGSGCSAVHAEFLVVRLSIVSTLYRSAAHLEEFHRRVSAVASTLTDDFEIVLVNDGSPDASLDVAVSCFAGIRA